jgi:hypothetical protein
MSTGMRLPLQKDWRKTDEPSKARAKVFKARSKAGNKEARRANEHGRWVLLRLAEEDGPAYDELVREVIKAFFDPARTGPHDYIHDGKRAVRAIRGLMWYRLVTTHSDESMWLTPEGWRELERITEPEVKERAS